MCLTIEPDFGIIHALCFYFHRKIYIPCQLLSDCPLSYISICQCFSHMSHYAASTQNKSSDPERASRGARCRWEVVIMVIDSLAVSRLVCVPAERRRRRRPSEAIRYRREPRKVWAEVIRRTVRAKDGGDGDVAHVGINWTNSDACLARKRQKWRGIIINKWVYLDWGLFCFAFFLQGSYCSGDFVQSYLVCVCSGAPLLCSPAFDETPGSGGLHFSNMFCSLYPSLSKLSPCETLFPFSCLFGTGKAYDVD